MKYSSRFFLYAPLGVFLVLLAVAGIHWWMLASALAARLDAVNGREVMPGVTLAFDSRRITGFPFSLDTEFKNLRLTVATAQGPTVWRSEHFAMHGLTYGREETIFEAAGHQSLAWKRADGVPRTLNFAVGSLRASAIDQHGALTRFDLDLVGFGSRDITAQRLQFHARQDAKAVQLFVEADGVTSCARTTLRHAATVSAGKAFERLQRGEQSWSEAVVGWRAAGGAVRSDGKNPFPSLVAEQVMNPSALADAVCGG